ncbi:hypothetical protein Back11_19760 [Paenibacillus baekrokdamisoli]|uniref:Uncharacterized protein n=1 Tax=Paenibacillus baekrokdamisoli TaxID=1712516 RepID=A0A3G9J4B2_9BACL|nr:patatin-like protein [Paenibacillus baekrokdamisoli]MBB3070020.1 putative acylesterase/phospholipase RssA [Paenibacillus baekrokdamisoli]BBH20631.1 hypothetical protein Back11_19760 [Paenibacillus baekrokdamisoli]
MELTKEVRIAIVLYGGVSLAVYMNGVSQELMTLTRSRRGADVDAEGNVYSRLLEKMNAEVIIDIIAGNSAGGINGVLLAKALATGTDLGAIKKLWRDTADLKNLLDHKGQPTETLLNGDFMLRELQHCFNELSEQIKANPKLADDRKSQINILDLFVSASDIRGRRWRIVDSKGQEIEGLKHGVMFHKKYRTAYGMNRSSGYEHNDFAGADNDELLARMSRATSAMPAAFPEQKFTMHEVYGGPNKYDKRHTVYLHDGLLTDNKPFGPVLDTIFHRSADRKVDRWLLFLDPTPHDTHLQQSDQVYKSKPTVIEAAKSYFSTPSYQSIYEQIHLIEEQRERFKTMTIVLDAIDKSVMNEEATKLPSFVPYCCLRAAEWEQSLIHSLQDQFAVSTEYRMKDPQQLSAIHHVCSYIRSLKESDELLKRVADMTLPDIAFYCRFFNFHIQKINRKLAELSPKETIQTARLLHQKEYLWAAIESLRQQQWEWWNDKDEWDRLKRQPFVNAIKNLHKEELSQSSILDIIRYMNSTLKQRLEKLQGKENLAAALSLKGWGDFHNQLIVAMRQFIGIDIFLYPLTLGHGGDTSKLELLRISSSDAKSLGLTGAAKLVGSDLAAFAGFLNKTWRANDLMWGRLDTADILITYMDKSHRQSTEMSRRELEEWEQLVEEVRADRFESIAREELRYVDEKLYQAFMSLQLVGSSAERLEKMRRFFNETYKVGLESWRDLPFMVRVKRSIETLTNVNLVLYRHYKSRIPLRLLLGGSSGFWLGLRWITKWISKE